MPNHASLPQPPLNLTNLQLSENTPDLIRVRSIHKSPDRLITTNQEVNLIIAHPTLMIQGVLLNSGKVIVVITTERMTSANLEITVLVKSDTKTPRIGKKQGKTPITTVGQTSLT